MWNKNLSTNQLSIAVKVTLAKWQVTRLLWHKTYMVISFQIKFVYFFGTSDWKTLDILRHTRLSPNSHHYGSSPVGHWGTNNTRTRDFSDKRSHDNWIPCLNSVVYTDKTTYIQQTSHLCNRNIALRTNLKWTVTRLISQLHHNYLLIYLFEKWDMTHSFISTILFLFRKCSIIILL